MSEALVKKYYYEQGSREWRRLVTDAYHRLEFDTTKYFVRKYLPKGTVKSVVVSYLVIFV